MKILVVGGGGREHAMVWKLRQSSRVENVWCVPGNGGISQVADCLPGDSGDVSGILKLAEKLNPDLTIVGPELPLVNGIADAFADRNWPIVAPSRQASQLEGSKVFAKEFLLRHKIATAKMYGSYSSATEALDALRGIPFPLVIKADGLCAGKGVVLPKDATEASDFIERALIRGEFGPGGSRLMLEETLTGDELSFIVLTDGERYAPLVATRDHKRAFDGDRGPNTGGMGAYSSDELLSDTLRAQILRDVVEPTLLGLRTDGIHYRGFLYFGLMVTASGPRVLEFNCRLGDPEAQAIVTRMDFDLAEVLADSAAGRLDPAKLRWEPGASVCVVLVSGGYPGEFRTQKAIRGLTGVSDDTGVTVFHAGTARLGASIVTSGGRVLGVTAAASTLESARANVYAAVEKIHFDGMYFRNDIAAQTKHANVAGG
jgi:phosphoribosylamine--glycine ligase